MIRRATLGAAILCVCVCMARPAAGYDFNIEATVIGQGYQVRSYQISGDTLLNRRRLHTSLRLNVWNLLPQKVAKPGDDAVGKPRPQLSFQSSMRYGADFGDFLEEAAVQGTDPITNGGIPELGHQVRELDVLYAYLEGTSFFGFLDFRAGRQVTVDLLDWFSFDGLTLRARTPWWVVVEAIGGFEVRGDRGAFLSSPLYELDGVEDDLELRDHLSPTFGGALELDGPRWASARLSYRRTMSQGGVGDFEIDRDLAALGIGDDYHVREEKLGLQVRGNFFAGRLVPFGGARLNLLVQRFDELQAGTRVAFGGRHAVTAEYQRSTPTWDGDSIFNVFTQYPYDDARLTYDVTPTPCWRGYARAMGRWFGNHECTSDGKDAICDDGFEVETTVPDLGGGVGARWKRGFASVRGDLYYLDGFGGRHAGGDLAGYWGFGKHSYGGDPNLRLDGRLTVVNFDNPLHDRLQATSFGAQVGVRWRFAQGMAAHVWVEENVNRFYPSQLRVIGVLDLAYWP